MRKLNNILYGIAGVVLLGSLKLQAQQTPSLLDQTFAVAETWRAMLNRSGSYAIGGEPIPNGGSIRLFISQQLLAESAFASVDAANPPSNILRGILLVGEAQGVDYRGDIYAATGNASLREGFGFSGSKFSNGIYYVYLFAYGTRDGTGAHRLHRFSFKFT
ncbi:MAG: hypothetical protein OXB93_01450, partial [Cytophagales bacterium]|nr:hypothetical protein [Cytophagales bacterium]